MAAAGPCHSGSSLTTDGGTKPCAAPPSMRAALAAWGSLRLPCWGDCFIDGAGVDDDGGGGGGGGGDARPASSLECATMPWWP